MTTKIKLDIISDVVCPWCIIGYKRIQQAISEMGIEDKIEIEWHPFELNTHMAVEGEELQQHIMDKYGTTLEENHHSLKSMTDFGAELGFTFDFFDGMKMVNTRDAHILLEYAKENGKQTELKLRFFTAFFSEQKDVSNREILLQELEGLGLNIDGARSRLNDEKSQKVVHAEEENWRNLGVSAVPTILFNDSNKLTGAQPVDVYKQVLTELIDQ